MPKPFWQLVSKLKLWKRLRKRLYIEDKIPKMKYDGFVEVQVLNRSSIKIKSFYNLLV